MWFSRLKSLTQKNSPNTERSPRRSFRNTAADTLLAGGRMDVVEGDSLPRIAIVIVEFPSMDAFKQFYDAPEYQAAKALRQSATRGTTLVVEGL